MTFLCYIARSLVLFVVSYCTRTHSNVSNIFWHSYICYADVRTIMSYHNGKMSEINKIIRELWRNTYKGNGVCILWLLLWEIISFHLCMCAVIIITFFIMHSGSAIRDTRCYVVVCRFCSLLDGVCLSGNKRITYLLTYNH